MVDIFLFEKIIFLLSIIIGFWLSIWVYISNREKKENIFFSAMIIVWILGVIAPYFVFRNFLINEKIILFLPRIEVASVFIFFILFYNFSINFLNEKTKFPYLNKITLIVASTGFFLSIFTNLFQQKVLFTNEGAGLDLLLTFEGKIGWLGFIFVITFFILQRFIANYLNASSNYKVRIQYFLVGLSVWILVNLVFNVYFPLFKNTFIYASVGNYSIIILFGLTAYAIVKQNLFGIKIVVTALLVSFIAILLSLDILIFTESQLLQFFKVIGLIMFLFLGRSLIMSVLKEEKMLVKMKKLNDDLANANDELKELIEMKTSFLHIVSHQLRTPLTAMRGYITMWQEGDFDDYSPRKMNEMKKRIANNTERLNNLVNEMVAAMESEGGIKLNFEKVDVEGIIKNNIELLKANYEKKKLYLRYRKTEKSLPKIEADAKYLSNAFMNLIDNAEKYTKKGGLKIKINREGDNVKLTFADTGIGIKPEDRKNLFHKFSRGAASSLINPNGSGLGLYIIKQIIREHRGKIEFESEGEEKGTVFIVTLPIRQMVSVGEAKEAVKAESAEVRA